jgi:DNA-directed RNA polymerase subunit RPC12/RpoP
VKEKEEQFHLLEVPCPRCSKNATILKVHFSIKGSIRVEMVCVVCGVNLTMLSSWDKVICYCASKEVTGAVVFETAKTLQ